MLTRGSAWALSYHAAKTSAWAFTREWALPRHYGSTNKTLLSINMKAKYLQDNWDGRTKKSMHTTSVGINISKVASLH